MISWPRGSVYVENRRTNGALIAAQWDAAGTSWEGSGSNRLSVIFASQIEPIRLTEDIRSIMYYWGCRSDSKIAGGGNATVFKSKIVSEWVCVSLVSGCVHAKSPEMIPDSESAYKIGPENNVRPCALGWAQGGALSHTVLSQTVFISKIFENVNWNRRSVRKHLSKTI